MTAGPSATEAGFRWSGAKSCTPELGPGPPPAVDGEALGRAAAHPAVKIRTITRVTGASPRARAVESVLTSGVAGLAGSVGWVLRIVGCPGIGYSPGPKE
ncbi:hypothetical protein GCM10025862_12430 [Arsenicicoccus piscis]|uniref:Uncharacterized protein n=1 Tax=Arsenicicoccus piscis TaxID=673954 RepID=A0ABQ6HM43_9MICO|nr:hypothetical protein GCM10025862_12430 [Arsenicicoccus piscis]